LEIFNPSPNHPPHIRRGHQSGAAKPGKAWLPVKKRHEPSQYLPRSKAPMLWVAGANDFACPFPSLQKSYRLPKGRRASPPPG